VSILPPLLPNLALKQPCYVLGIGSVPVQLR
jgi:hypothetical protein